MITEMEEDGVHNIVVFGAVEEFSVGMFLFWRDSGDLHSAINRSLLGSAAPPPPPDPDCLLCHHRSNRGGTVKGISYFLGTGL